MQVTSTSNWIEILTSERPLIDVRAPIEFSKGSFPNAINLPLLVDKEREEVGTTFKQFGQKAAIECGERLISPEIKSERTEEWVRFVKSHPDAYLFCARGGLRSKYSQEWCKEEDVSVPRIEGGYKALRKAVMESFIELCGQTSFVVVAGRTGIGKTRFLLTHENNIDLEGAAGHRGSSFGRGVFEQSTQVNFEHAIAIKLHRLRSQSNKSFVLLEDEGRTIGRVHVPPAMREAMLKSPLLVLEATLEERVDNVLQDYVVELSQKYIEAYGRDDGLKRFGDKHLFSLEKISKRLGDKDYRMAKGQLEQAIEEHIKNGDTNHYREFIGLLLTSYYDPMYDYQLKAKESRIDTKGRALELNQWLAQK